MNIYKNKLLLILLLLSFFSLSLATTIYENSFENTTGWATFAGSTSPTISESKMSIDNSSKNDFSVIIHNDAAISSLSSFTISIEMVRTSATQKASGLYFCLQSESFEGYTMALRPDKQYTLLKWISNGSGGYTTQTLTLEKNSFINDSINTIKISKSGENISLFCNDEFLETVVDNSYDKGDIALAAGANESPLFDNLKITDQTTSGSNRLSFSDNFDDGTISGWRILSNDGTISESGTKLHITSGTSDTYLYTNGFYGSAACTTVVTREGGDASKYYGIMYLSVIQNASTIPGRNFIINGNSNYKISKLGSSSTQKTNSNISGNSDTIIVSKDHSIVVNGATLDNTTFTTGGDFNAIALYVEAGADVSFYSFSAAADNTPILIPNNEINYSNKSQEYEIGGTGIIYDIRGRKVATFMDNNYKKQLKNLGNGRFFIVAKDKSQHIIRRAIINTK